MLYNTLRQYEYVVAVAERGSLTEAAAALHVSQPSLSVAISRVEETLGQAVFVRRKGAAIQVTPFGHRLVADARRLLELANAIEQHRDATRPFVLGCFADIAPWHLAPALKALRERFPAQAFQGFEGRFAELASALSEGRVDVALSYDVGFGEGFARRKLREVAPVAFLSRDHPLAGCASLELQQLAECPLILSSEELSQGYMRGLFDRLGLAPAIAARAASLESMRSLAAHGNGVGISYTAPPFERSYDGCPLVTCPISSPEAVADIVLVWSRLRQVEPPFAEICDVIAGL